VDLLTMTATVPDFTTVTEVPGVNVTRSELSQILTRYHWAAQGCRSLRILELGCGSGQGLGYFLGHGAATVVGTDIEEANLAHARRHYAGRTGIELAVVDAQQLPYPDADFDLVLLFEAIYYLPDAKRFLAEAFRVLRPGGRLLISTVNRSWPQFNPSPFSHWYPTVPEFHGALVQAGFTARIKGGYPDTETSLARKLVRMIRRGAVRLRLIPDTMKGKEFLKRIFYGRLLPMPHELADGCGDLEPLVELDPLLPHPQYTFLYAEATRP